MGLDIADNAYTAYDPVFWSLHSNIDRVFEEWLRGHPAAMFTSRFPLRPFTWTTCPQRRPHRSGRLGVHDHRRHGQGFPQSGGSFRPGGATSTIHRSRAVDRARSP
ncbi:MAG: tyrosinase family protein [Actinomycetota bacterium]